MTVQPVDGVPAPRRQPYLEGFGRHFRSRRGLIVLGAIALVLGAALNWSWLVAAGIAPILIALLPCAAMCALGLCMNKAMNRSNPSYAPSDTTSEPSTVPFARIQGRRSSGHTEESESDHRPLGASKR